MDLVICIIQGCCNSCSSENKLKPVGTILRFLERTQIKCNGPSHSLQSLVVFPCFWKQDCDFVSAPFRAPWERRFSWEGAGDHPDSTTPERHSRTGAIAGPAAWWETNIPPAARAASPMWAPRLPQARHRAQAALGWGAPWRFLKASPAQCRLCTTRSYSELLS